jgi:hypothetical protein
MKNSWIENLNGGNML